MLNSNFHDPNDVDLTIRCDHTFFKEFRKYLTGKGMSEAPVEDIVGLITSFAKFNVKKDKQKFSLARLANTFQLKSEDLILLPAMDDWLDHFESETRRNDAHCAYNDLLDFIEELLVVHKGLHPCPFPQYSKGHIPEEENIFRRQHLKALEKLVLATHPTKTWANPSLLHENK